ncbi:type IX secretion system membrane protein PorP/SprF [Aggregatimonas sangjinii]|uniref:Type IX secretion system membrane protein PorP/SprF n=1 Tax=Aggregatimonas sangjinii TaxID=2583587 RepID=A0A5B7STP5_9FLAO|nr:PorP/SprF family type IX secretion system membrane protein [Aggregatimonas sangjinii]QCX00240.1 type IX secretion system membrane protein PorP/SprF [Aggregatimonas sangjinii]
MFKKVPKSFFLLWVLCSYSQNNAIPVDLRQHNLTEYNSSFFNPVLSSYGTEKQSVALWTRWQWQEVDTDPTTLFLNYKRQINPESSAGLGFFQHNTGVYLNTGGVLNYAYSYTVNPNVKFGIGLNLLGFKQVTAGVGFLGGSQTPSSELSEANDFVLQMAPGLYLKWKNLGIGFTSENLLDYNFTQKARNSGAKERIYAFSTTYDFYLFSNSISVRPTAYWKSIPFQDDQIGLNMYFSAAKYWAQAGYNSFYGASVGIGGRFFKKASVGVLVEWATDAALDGKKPTYEVIAAYNLGKSTRSIKKVSIYDVTKESASKRKRKKKRNQRKVESAAEQWKKADSINSIRKAEAEKVAIEKSADSLKIMALEEAQELARQRTQEEEALRNQRKIDSIALKTSEQPSNKVVSNEKDEILERYEEVASEDGLKSGYYLIANVFRSEQNYKSFVQSLIEKELQPKFFLRSSNQFYYVYLKRYETINEAVKARNSKFFGKYLDEIWIFRVVGE